jgi:hypothetical protein
MRPLVEECAGIVARHRVLVFRETVEAVEWFIKRRRR